MFPMLAMLAVQAISTGLQAKEASDQRDIQRRNEKVKDNTEMVSAMQQRRQNARRERIRRAQLEQAAISTGTTGSSGLLGAQSAIGSLQGGTQSFSNFGRLSSTIIGNNNQDLVDSAFRAQMVGGLASLASGAIRGANNAGWFTNNPDTTPATTTGDVFDLGGADPFDVGISQR